MSFTDSIVETPLATPLIRRKLNGYVGFANLPKQWHRKSIRRGFNFNLMVIGEKGLGKTTLINTLFNKELIVPSKEPLFGSIEEPVPVTIDNIQAEIEENNVKLHLSVITATGFGDNINNSESWQPIVSDINRRFDEYLESETKINRSTITDNRVHALLYFIEPTGHSLKPLDIAFMKSVHEKVNLIPVIAKSDILTETEVHQFKLRILEDIKEQGIKLFTPPEHENDDDETKATTNEILSKIPYAIVGSNNYVQTSDGRMVRARTYPWGVIEIDNEQHCDFIKLRQLLIRNFMEQLKETTSKNLYENYRTQKLLGMGIVQDDTVFKEFDPVLKQQEEKKISETKLQNLEQQMKQIFQQKVAREEKKLQETEADLFSKHKEMRDKLLTQIKKLEEKKRDLSAAKPTPAATSNPAPAKTRKGFLH